MIGMFLLCTLKKLITTIATLIFFKEFPIHASRLNYGIKEFDSSEELFRSITIAGPILGQ